MLLPKPKEPMEIKETFEDTLQKHPDWGRDWLAGLMINKVAGYLWSDCRWKETLKAEGISWQRFEKLFSFFNNRVRQWFNGVSSWVSLEQEIERELSRLVSIARRDWPRLA